MDMFLGEFAEDRREEGLQKRGQEWHAGADYGDVAFYDTPVDGGCVVVWVLLAGGNVGCGMGWKEGGHTGCVGGFGEFD